MKKNPLLKNPYSYCIAIFLFAFLLYGNSIKNNYSLDDEMVTLNNPRVEKGFAGIPEIFTKHHSIDTKSRYEYRPLVLMTFALEYQFFGRNPHLSHFINVLLYAFTCVLIFYLLLHLLTGCNFIFPLLTVLLFAAHPLHTEVVDNLKSRDELISLLNSLLALYFLSCFTDTNKKYFFLLGFLFLFFAILSKKTAVIFIPLIPLTLYFFKNTGWKHAALLGAAGIFILILFFVFRRVMVPEKDVRVFDYFENPLFFERGLLKRIPAAFYTLWYYIRLLVFPHPLSFYYGYNQIPLAGWAHPLVWVSAVFHIGVFAYAMKSFFQKSILSFAILFYLISILLFANFYVPVVGIIAERFTYTASLGFCLVTAYFIMKLFKVTTSGTNPLFIGLSAIILLLYSFKTITRNPDWKDHLTLYRNDIKHLDKSAKAHSMISNTIYPDLFKISDGVEKNKLIDEAVFHYKKSLEIYPDYIVSNNNLGSIYFTFFGDFKTASYYFKKAVSLDTNYLEAHFNLGYSYEKLGMPDSAIVYFEKTLLIDAKYKLAYDKLYPLYFSAGKYDKAIKMSLRAADSIPSQKALYYVNTGNIYSTKKDTMNALMYFVKAFESEPYNKDLCTHIARVYQSIHNNIKAEEYFRKAEKLK